MDDSMLALLEKSRMFNSFCRGFFCEAKAISPKGYAFWLPHCFKEHSRDDSRDGLKRFNHELKSFFRRYLETWVDKNKTSEEVEAAIKDLFSVANFLGNLGQEKDFIKLSSGKDIVEIHEPISNAKFRFKRIGDLLAFNIFRPGRSSDEAHTTGKKTVLALCRSKDRNRNQGIYELIQRVAVTLEVPEVSFSESRNRNGYSLARFRKEIGKALYLMSIGDYFSSDKLIKNYQTLKGDLPIGNWRGLSIVARLIHLDAINNKEHIASDDYNFRDRAMAWRRGNLVRVTDSREVDFYLTENSPIALRISINSSLSERGFAQVDRSGKYMDEQFLIANVGSMVAMNLGSMMLDRHDEKFYQMNPIER